MAVALAVPVAGFCWNVWPEWRHNPDLSHGLFAPMIFLLLLWEGRRNGTQRWLPDNGLVWGVQIAAVTGAFLLFVFAGLIAASLAWTHALVHFALALSLSALLFVGLIYFGREPIRLLPVNWITFTAVSFWVLAAPIPTGTYMRLTLKLQLLVTTGVLHALHLLGVPARQIGNLIELATTTVGIEDACSGIRSLISCVFAGVVFSAWQVRRPGGRALLILLAAPLAIGTNFLRSLTLTLLANGGVRIAGFWHDATGYGILIVTAGVLAVLAMVLESPSAAPVPPAPSRHAPTAGGATRRRCFWTVWAGLGAALALALFFTVQSRPPMLPPRPPPALANLFPANPPGWKALPPTNLHPFASVLRTNNLAQRTYLKPTGTQLQQVTFYVAYWAAGETPVSFVASHTPEACWPGAGWIALPADPLLPKPTLPGRTLPPAEYRLFRRVDGFDEHVWFWHIYDGRVIAFRDPYSVPALLRIALDYGYRRQGDQVFVRISSNQPWSVLATEPLFQEVLTNLSHLGL